MPKLHCAGQVIQLTEDEAKDLRLSDLYAEGQQSLNTEYGWVTFTTGPGVPILLDEREGHGPRLLDT